PHSNSITAAAPKSLELDAHPSPSNLPLCYSPSESSPPQACTSAREQYQWLLPQGIKSAARVSHPGQPTLAQWRGRAETGNAVEQAVVGPGGALVVQGPSAKAEGRGGVGPNCRRVGAGARAWSGSEGMVGERGHGKEALTLRF
ncbi:unnamed protein product, partial [Urochloa humidicola]